MKENSIIMSFRFASIEFDESDTTITAVATLPAGRKIEDVKGEIEDCIASYIDANEAWSFEGLVRDVLKSMPDISFTIPEPIVFEI